ncbi:peptidoglycan binding domain-containing protein [Streptomyces lutosisoli]|uniref:Peptidoglycan binding domain-containing protein n=1 Tax=Streptomyces lutosisoli TaxID=2665721 RepID=A0ABW2VBU9_9ACTN
MSRETDSSSSGPNGRGGAAYPSGTPPYGTPMASESGADAGRSATGNPPEERKTETTLTTRIRINIPGSRPIPPVVVRTPVADADGSAVSAEGADGVGTGAEVSPGVSSPIGAATATATSPSTAPSADGPAGAPATAEEKTSDWFAPRKSGAPKGGPGGGSTNGAGLPGGSGPAGAAGSPGTQGGRPGAPGGARPSPANGAGPLGAPGGPRPGGAHVPRPGGGTNGAGLPGATGAGPVAPGHGGGTGSFDVSAALSSTGSFPAVGSPASSGNGGERRRDDLPYFSEGGPAGPTGGPVTGDGPLVPPAGPGVAPGSLAAGPGTGPGAGYPGGGPGGPGSMSGPGGPGTHVTPRGGLSGGLSDDTAILTPQKPAPEPGAGGYGGPGDNVSGHTLTSGIPVVPSAQNSPFGPGAHTDGPLPHTPPKLPEPVQQPAASSKPAKKKKGRSKLTLLVVGVVVIGGGAYGAGLLMNHSDVPKGTTVLGVDIGGGTRDEAVKKLDDAFSSSTNKALKLSVDGDTVSLKPDQAGLQFDTQATVRAAAGSDYNPVSVIGSLFGQERVVEPEMPVDEEKLQAALEGVASGSGSASDGTIKFVAGKAVAVYGKAGKGIDVSASTQAVEDAYRAQVESDTTTPVKVATTTRQPTISKTEVDRMMKAFAKPAMSANVTVRTDAVHTISFSPQNSIWQFLSVRAVDGKLVQHYDLATLKKLYGGAFDGVTITKGDGSKKAVSPQDVASALGQALLGKTAADRIVTISTNPS